MSGSEWSLLVFTILMQASVGLFVTREIIHFFSSKEQGIETADRMCSLPFFIIGPLIVAAVMASFFHLGNPFKAYFAINNLGTSWLSREILLVLMFSGSFFLYVFLLWRKVLTILMRRLFALIIGIFGLALIFAMAKIYMLPTVPSWNTAWTPLSFFMTTFLLGSLSAAALLTLKPGLNPGFAGQVIKKISLISALLIGIQITVIPFSLPGSHILIHMIRLLCLVIAGSLVLVARHRARSKDRLAGKDNRLIYTAFFLVLIAEVLGRYLFYASFSSVGV